MNAPLSTLPFPTASSLPHAALLAGLSQTSDVVIITDHRATIRFVNRAFTQVTGYSAEEALGQNPRLLKSGRQGPSQYAEIWQRLSSGAPWQGRLVNRRKDGSEYVADVIMTPIRGEGGRTTHYVATQRDVTDVLRMLAELLHSQKCEALGAVAGGVMHDVNNLLQVIQLEADLLLEASADEGHRESLLEIVQSARTAGAMSRGALQQLRTPDSEPGYANLSEVLTALDPVIRRIMGTSHAVVARLGSGDACIPLAPSELQQLVLNLVVNARDALSAPGEIRLIATGGAEPGTAELVVEDNGPGIAPEIRSRVLEPFFTTKKAGTGLGLSTVARLVRKARGELFLEDAVPSGARFRIRFPIAPVVGPGG